jgi:hypothetical membrane protein
MRQIRVFGLAGLLGASVFTASLIVLHLTRIDVDWTRHYISDFANGRFGRVFVLGVVVHGLGNLALNLGLRRSLDPGPLRAWAVFFFGLAVAGIVVAALFPIEPAGRSPTPVGLVHRVATIATFPLELAALFLFTAAFARHPRWRRRKAVSLVLSTVAAVGVAGFFLAVFLSRLPGLAERFALASFLAWELWVSLQLARSASGIEVAR